MGMDKLREPNYKVEARSICPLVCEWKPHEILTCDQMAVQYSFQLGPVGDQSGYLAKNWVDYK